MRFDRQTAVVAAGIQDRYERSPIRLVKACRRVVKAFAVDDERAFDMNVVYPFDPLGKLGKVISAAITGVRWIKFNPEFRDFS